MTAATRFADLPELGKLDRHEIAARVGVAPTNADTGRKRGYRKTKGGRPDIRRALYMSTLTAIRYNPTLKPQYDQLVKRGKLKLLFSHHQKTITALTNKTVAARRVGRIL